MIQGTKDFVRVHTSSLQILKELPEDVDFSHNAFPGEFHGWPIFNVPMAVKTVTWESDGVSIWRVISTNQRMMGVTRDTFACKTRTKLTLISAHSVFIWKNGLLQGQC